MKYHPKTIFLLIICGLFVLCLFVRWQLVLALGLMVLGTLGYFEKIISVRLSKNLRISLLVAFMALSLGQLIYSHVKEGNLSDKLKKAEDATAKAKEQIQELKENEHELRERLQQAENTATKATQKADLLQYQDIALYRADGNKSGSIGGVRFVTTPINDWSEGFVTRREGKIDFNCSSEAISACKTVIERLPLYPFSYYFLAKCLREQKDPLWREYALKARQILNKTTALPGHSSDHDAVLRQIGELLNE